MVRTGDIKMRTLYVMFEGPKGLRLSRVKWVPAKANINGLVQMGKRPGEVVKDVIAAHGDERINKGLAEKVLAMRGINNWPDQVKALHVAVWTDAAPPGAEIETMPFYLNPKRQDVKRIEGKFKDASYWKQHEDANDERRTVSSRQVGWIGHHKGELSNEDAAKLIEMRNFDPYQANHPTNLFNHILNTYKPTSAYEKKALADFCARFDGGMFFSAMKIAGIGSPKDLRQMLVFLLNSRKSWEKMLAGRQIEREGFKTEFKLVDSGLTALYEVKRWRGEGWLTERLYLRPQDKVSSLFESHIPLKEMAG